MPKSIASIVIPAHNEAASIVAVLRGLAPLRDDVEIVVVCNGCTDATAEMARERAPWATVLELDVSSKTAALQAGDEAVQAFPRLYLDGDITIEADGVRRLRNHLMEAQLEGVAPTPLYETTESSSVVRAHYRWWTAAQAMRHTLTGAGAIMVSADVRRRFDRWPNILADDFFLDGMVARDAKRRVDDVTVTVQPPRQFRECVSRRARVRQGNRQATTVGLPRTDPPRRRHRKLIEMVRARPDLLRDAPAHALVVGSASALGAWRRLRGTDRLFYRDESRQHAASSIAPVESIDR